MILKKQVFILLTLFVFTSFLKVADSKGQQKLTEGDMDASKWWMGIKTGANFTSPQIIVPYSVFSGENLTLEKSYSGSLQNKGFQIGILAGHAFTNFLSVTIQPSYFIYSYSYQANYNWIDTVGNKIDLNFNYQQILYYLDIPLFVRFYYKLGKFQPFIQGGGYYGILLNGRKNISIEENNTLSGAAYDFTETKKTFNNKNLFLKSLLGWTLGAGLTYDIEWFRIGFEVNYRGGLNNITNVKNRFSENNLVSGVYDLMDDLKLRNTEVSLSVAVPLDNLVHVSRSGGKPSKKRKRAN